MIDFLAATRKLTKHQAYQVVSIAGNVADHAARGQAEPRRPREDAEEHLHVAECRTGTRAGDPRAGETLERIAGARRRRARCGRCSPTSGRSRTATAPSTPRPQYLADLRSGDRKFFGDVKQDEFTVRCPRRHGDRGRRQRVEGRYKGRPGGGPLRFTRVYMKRDGPLADGGLASDTPPAVTLNRVRS